MRWCAAASPQERLVLVEYNPDFCKLLRRRFPKATVLQATPTTSAPPSRASCRSGPARRSRACALHQALEQRLDLLTAVHDLMHPDAPFVQFTYAVVPPIRPSRRPTRRAAPTRSGSTCRRPGLGVSPALTGVRYRRPAAPTRRFRARAGRRRNLPVLNLDAVQGGRAVVLERRPIARQHGTRSAARAARPVPPPPNPVLTYSCSQQPRGGSRDRAGLRASCEPTSGTDEGAGGRAGRRRVPVSAWCGRLNGRTT